MNAKLGAYWATTGLLALALLGGGVANLSKAPQLVENLGNLGYPLYFMNILGTWQILGALAILAPGLPKLKEWAYAGITFTFTGAVASHLWSNDPLSTVVPPLFLLTVALVSWAWRPEERKWS